MRQFISRSQPLLCIRITCQALRKSSQLTESEYHGLEFGICIILETTGDSNVKPGLSSLIVHLILFQCPRELSKVVVGLRAFYLEGREESYTLH